MSPDGDVLGYEIIYNWQFLFSSPGGDVMSQILVISEQPEETPGVEVPEFSSPNGDVLSYAILYNWQFLFSSPDGDAMFRPKVAKQYLLPTPCPHYNKKILPMQGNPFDRTENSGAKGRGVGLAKARLGRDRLLWICAGTFSVLSPPQRVPPLSAQKPKRGSGFQIERSARQVCIPLWAGGLPFSRSEEETDSLLCSRYFPE